MRFTKTGQMMCNDERVCNDDMQHTHAHIHIYTYHEHTNSQTSIHKNYIMTNMRIQACTVLCEQVLEVLHMCLSSGPMWNTQAKKEAGLIFLGFLFASLKQDFSSLCFGALVSQPSAWDRWLCRPNHGNLMLIRHLWDQPPR